MIAFSQVVAGHAIGSVLTALAICLTAGILLGALLRKSARSTDAALYGWLCGTALVTGLGVWTTHFIAAIGYRPDLPLNYGLGLTVVSAAIGVLAVGLPLAATVLARSRGAKASLGALAGSGIGAMHFTGMSAIDGCVQTQSYGSAVAACIVGAVFLAIGRAVPTFADSRRMTCLLFTAAVCGTHFTAIGGTSFAIDAASNPFKADQTTLGILVSAGAAVLLVGALLTLLGARRFDAQERAHSTILSTALQNMSNGLVFVDGTGRVRLFNDRFVELFGFGRDSLRIGIPFRDMLDLMAQAGGSSPDRHAALEAWLDLRLSSKAAAPSDHRLPDGRIVEIDSNLVVGGGVVLTFDDVTDARSARQEITRLAFNDPLTGLANRRALQLRMEEGFRSNRLPSLLAIDLDHFKFVNDTYGHAIGDELLVEVAGRLREVAGPDSFVARLGGDEFAIGVDGAGVDAAAVAEAAVAAIARPFRIGHVSMSIGCSAGVCAARDAASPEEQMQRADIALYEAKRQGRGRYAVYRIGMQEAAAERHRLVDDMRTAMEESQFHLAYQPIVSLGTNEIIGYEALLRWDHPVLGSMSPTAFVPIAEETGQIVAMGQWVLEEACRTAAGWTGGQYIAVNVSAVQFRSPLLSAHIVGALAASGLPASRLEIELTETALVEDGTHIAHVLSDLRELGITVAMDDFGTGYSSLAHMRDFPVDRIKIDRSFAAAAENDRHSMAVIKAVLLMGRDLDIATLAEGVETESQLEILRDLGCDAVQGFLLGRPLRLDGPLETDRRTA